MLDLISFLGEGNLFAQMLMQTQARRGTGFDACDMGIGVLRKVAAVDARYDGMGFDMEFESECSHEDGEYWHAEFCIAPSVDPEDSLIIFLNDAQGVPIPTGKLFFLGLALPVEEGVVECPLIHLRDNLKNTDIFLQKANGCRVPGRFF